MDRYFFDISRNTCHFEVNKKNWNTTTEGKNNEKTELLRTSYCTGENIPISILKEEKVEKKLRNYINKDSCKLIKHNKRWDYLLITMPPDSQTQIL